MGKGWKLADLKGKTYKDQCDMVTTGFLNRLESNNRIAKDIQNEVRNSLTRCPSNLESPVSHEPLAAQENKRPNSPCSIHFHSVRKRLADADGISAKAAIDGLVIAGLLPDDSPQYVKEVSYSQAKGEPEETVITIEWED